jgi:antitoxin MazE
LAKRHLDCILNVSTNGLEVNKMATVQKWGNSLAVRIPQSLAGLIDVTEGTAVELSVRDGELILRPSKPSQLHGEADFGNDVGREIVD